jgi:hypothetical protein
LWTAVILHWTRQQIESPNAYKDSSPLLTTSHRRLSGEARVSAVAFSAADTPLGKPLYTACVQNLQRVAAIGISDRHCGQGFVVTSSTTGFFILDMT